MWLRPIRINHVGNCNWPRTNIPWTELDKLFLNYELASDEDVVKITILYFIELTMTGRERKTTHGLYHVRFH